MDDGACKPFDLKTKCGPGHQRKARTCEDGDIDKCIHPIDRKNFNCNVKCLEIGLYIGYIYIYILRCQEFDRIACD